MTKRKPKSALDALESLSFSYREQLDAIVKDLEWIDKVIPRESSRSSFSMDKRTQGNEIAIIEHRKTELLSYIQTVCRDHIVWSKKLLDIGWTAEHAISHEKKRRRP